MIPYFLKVVSIPLDDQLLPIFFLFIFHYLHWVIVFLPPRAASKTHIKRGFLGNRGAVPYVYLVVVLLLFYLHSFVTVLFNVIKMGSDIITSYRVANVIFVPI